MGADWPFLEWVKRNAISVRRMERNIVEYTVIICGKLRYVYHVGE